MTWTADRIEMRPLAALSGFKNNARTHSPEQIATLAAAITEFGFTAPLIVRSNGTILAGHGRAAAAAKVGLSEVPCIVVPDTWTDAQVRAYVLADNAIAARSGWDRDLLRVELGALKGAGFNLDLIGFPAPDLTGLLAPLPVKGHGDPDVIPEPEPAVVTRPGDLWQLGEHRLLCGDSTSGPAIQSLMAGRTADLIFTSPPYAQQRDYGAAKDKVSAWDALMQGVFAAAPTHATTQLLVNLGLVHREGEWLPYWDAWIAWMRDQGWRRFGWYVWDQGPGLPGDWNGRLAPAHEFIFHFNREPIKPNKTVAAKHAGETLGGGGLRAKDGKVAKKTGHGNAIQAHKIPDSVLRVMRHKGGLGKAGKHPAVFPVALAEEMLTAYSLPGSVVFEPFSGSGTQLVAAHKTGRICHACELDPQYVDVAIRRWQAFAGESATLAATGETFDAVRQQRA